MKPLISLLTDFGVNDPFVGQVKAAIFTICPDAEVIDITHEVDAFNVRMGAFLLASATPYFPENTIHVAVVDPGVGGQRRPIVIETRRARYVGPDNGLMIPAAEAEGIKHVYELTNRSMMRDTISPTFHGRDIFAPVAAHLACGRPQKELGREIKDYVRFSFGEPKFDGRQVTCEVVHCDKFGNVVTNIPRRLVTSLTPQLDVRAHTRRFRARLVKTYSELEGNNLGFLIGSHGFVELAYRESSAARKLNLRPGDALRITMD